MQTKFIFMCTTDLKRLRKARRWSVEQLAEKTYIARRTLDRILAANGTGNETMARQLSQAFSIPFEQLFTKVNATLLEALRDYVPPFAETAPLPGMTYYLLHVRRISDMEANIWSKTKWVGPYDARHELRVLHELSEAGVARLYQDGLPVVNTPEDWQSLLFHSQIGRMQRILLSRQAAEGWMLSYITEEYVVAPAALMETNLPDVILLGDYPDRDSVRSRRAVERAPRRRRRKSV